MANYCSNNLEIVKFHNKNKGEEFLNFLQDNADVNLFSREDNILKEAFIWEYYLADVCTESQRASMHFESRWDPNISELVGLAKKYEFDFDLQYDELGCSIFGKASFDFEKDELIDEWLPHRIIQGVVYNTDEGYTCYQDFDCVVFWNHSEYELLEDLFEEYFEKKY